MIRSSFTALSRNLGAIALFSCWLAPHATAELQKPAGLDSAPFRVDSGYLARHDIVYLAPMKVPVEGFPLGNGDMGGLVWTHDRGIEFQINKNDIWSNPESAHGRVPRHAARVSVSFGVPVFNWIHTLNHYEGRLSLAQGEASFTSQTCFGTTRVRTWLAQDANVWVVECDGEEDASPISARLERIGSRAFGSWYNGGFDKSPGAGKGGSNPQVTVEGKSVYLIEKGSGMDFAVGLRVLGKGKTEAMRHNRFSGEITAQAPQCQILVAVATAEDSKNPAEEVRNLLNRAEKAGVAALRKTRDDWFRRFWNRSFVHLGDDYLENLWYLRRYLTGCGSRGKYPLIFNGGLWRWNRDVTNWITPHHWNTQQQYWGLCAANDVDLMRPYCETYTRMATERPAMQNLAARRGAKEDAILLAEMHNFDGTMVQADRGDMVHAFTQAAQVSSRLWEVYEFNRDKEYLRKTAYPFMRRAANFYLQKLQWDESRKVFTMKGSVYEDGNGRGPVKEPESDREYIEDLFTSCIAASRVLGLDRERAERMQHVLDHLWPRLFVRRPKYPAGEVISPDFAGKYSVDGWAIGGLVAFPAGNIGIDRKDTREGRAVSNFVKGTASMYSHHPTPVIAARMGMGNDALRLVRTGVETMQYFPSGLMFNCTSYPDAIYQLDYKKNMVGSINLLWKDFYQCGMETTSLTALTFTEMMLQSNEGKIRVFPAVPDEWRNKNLAFALLARGGFLVAATWKNDGVDSVAVKSSLGGECAVQNPWPGKNVKVRLHGANAPVPVRQGQKGAIVFDTAAGREYRLSPEDAPVAEPLIYRSQPNDKPKKTTWGKRVLGVEAGF